MEQRIIQYVSYLRGIYLKEYDDEERKKICEQVLVQIGFFQHERLIHLIVTVTFALLAVVTFGICAVAPSVPFFGLECLLLVENSVQTMYRCYDKLSKEAFHEVPKKGENK